MKYYVLYNPLAGDGKAEEKITKLSDFFDAELVNMDVTKISDYKDFFAGVSAEDAIILCGGDGTINRFVNDTAEVKIPCDVLYYAIGTGNDFLRDVEKVGVKEPFSIKKYLQNLPVVTVKGKDYYFLNNVGFGIDGYCCEVGDEMKKASPKPVNYTSIAIKGLLFHYKPTNATLVVDGKEYKYNKVWLAPTMKGRFYGGGMMPTPEQDRMSEDGKLSVMFYYGKGKIRSLIAFPSMFKGEHLKYKNMIKIHSGHDITVKFDRPAPLQIDGETIVGVTEYHAVAKTKVKA
ncbi:MAG: diacylglycerol kinase family protein [Ruminococcus sp.]|nr:diacylglycerol kinase family protein [Ruminococcus sp.]